MNNKHGEIHVAIDEGLARECGVVTVPTILAGFFIKGDIFEWRTSRPSKLYPHHKWRKIVTYHNGVFKILKTGGGDSMQTSYDHRITMISVELCDPDFVEKVKQWVARNIQCSVDWYEQHIEMKKVSALFRGHV